MSRSYIKPIVSTSMAGSIGLTIIASLQGCGGDQPPTPPPTPAVGTISDAANTQQGMFMIIQQTGANPGTYELKEKYPASETRAILKDLNGNERILSADELKKIAEAEAKKVEAGTSNLTQPIAQNQGMSLGETLLASAAGALVGGIIANKLMNNSNYQQHQQYQRRHTQPSSINRSLGNTGSSTTDARAVNSSSSQPKSGFFGSGSSSSSHSSGSSSGSFFGG